MEEAKILKCTFGCKDSLRIMFTKELAILFCPACNKGSAKLEKEGFIKLIRDGRKRYEDIKFLDYKIVE